MDWDSHAFGVRSVMRAGVRLFFEVACLYGKNFSMALVMSTSIPGIRNIAAAKMIRESCWLNPNNFPPDIARANSPHCEGH
jgi:hypothetical protein